MLDNGLPPPHRYEMEPQPNETGQPAKRKKSKLSPVKWALIRTQFVKGELFSLSEVARVTGIARSAVMRRAEREGWLAQRNRHAERLVAKLESETGDSLVVPSQDAVLAQSVADAQALSARSLLALTPDLIQELQSISALVSTLIATGHAQDLARLPPLIALRESTTEQIRILSGLPNPDRIPRARVNVSADPDRELAGSLPSHRVLVEPV